MTINDSFSSGALNFSDLNIEPHSLEETIIRFVRMYRPPEFANAPNDPLLRKYTKGVSD
jgi:hypothetical protein